MSNMSTNPWDPNFVPAAVDQAIISAVQGALNTAGQVVTDVTGTPPAPPTAPAAGTTTTVNIPAPVPDVSGTLENVINSATGSIGQAMQDLAPELEAQLTKEWQAALERVITNVAGKTPAPAPITIEDFTHADARNRAFRTLLGGLVVAVLTGLVSAAGALGGVNWFTHDGQIAAISIAWASVLTSVGAYIGRLVKEPASTAPVTSQLPSKNPSP